MIRQTGLDVRVCKHSSRRRISRRRLILGCRWLATGFGVQKIVNLACGSFYALGAYFGITFISYATQFGLSPAWLIFPGLIVSGILLGFIGPPIERLLRSVYGRDESFQLLLTFALVLIFQDVFKFFWGANPRSLDSAYLIYGTLSAGDFSVPVYNLLVMLAAIAIAAGLGLFLQRTNYGRLLRATAENRAMAEALGVDVRRIYAAVFTLGAIFSGRLRAPWWCRRPPPRSIWRSILLSRRLPSLSSAGSAQCAVRS